MSKVKCYRCVNFSLICEKRNVLKIIFIFLRVLSLSNLFILFKFDYLYSLKYDWIVFFRICIEVK